MTSWVLVGGYAISNVIGYDIYRDQETDEWGVKPWSDNAWIEVVSLDEDKSVLLISEEMEIPLDEVVTTQHEIEVPHKTEIRTHIMVRCLSLDDALELFHEIGSINCSEYEITALWYKYQTNLCLGTWPGTDYGKKMILAFGCAVDDSYIKEHKVPVYLYKDVEIPIGRDWNECEV